MKTIIAALITFTIGLYGLVPNANTNPDTFNTKLNFAVHHIEVAKDVLNNGMVWCDSCGEPYKADSMSWESVENEPLFICKDCKEFFEK